ncbi:MAG: hypothetical protein A2521_00335 [Deltaproteobacteria bacterium RIFOXYD12_FULL_57_12]|nr:MAG: hypothetical protein A2521_00335 [Deltaproteobacteria bacterium RIFOXYD12_FULL_57_12]
MKVYKPPSKQLIKGFERECNRASAWLDKADDLLFSSKILCDNCGFLTTRPDDVFAGDARILWVINMLRAMAIENLFKGVWLRSGEILAEDGSFKGIPGASNHKLLSLAEKVAEKIEFNFSKEEYILLDRLSYCIVFGRYPVQKNWSIGQGIPHPTGSSGLPGYQWSLPRDEILVESIIGKLRRAYNWSGIETGAHLKR